MAQATPDIPHGAAELRHIALGFQRPLPRTAFGQLGSTLLCMPASPMAGGG